MTRLRMQRTVDAPAPVAWDVITDHQLYAEAAPNLALVDVVEGDGEGMVRRCVDTDGNEWTETVTRWDEERGFAVSVDVANSEFHRRLFTRFEGEWSLADTDDGVEMAITFEFEPRFGPLGVLISKFLEYRAPGLVEAIFDRWERAIETRSQTDPESDQPAEASQPPQRPNALYP